MSNDHIQLVIAVLGFLGGIVALITALVSRRRELIHRKEFVHRYQQEASAGVSSPRPFVCPECRGGDFTRARGVKGFVPRLVLSLLLAWPGILVITLLATGQGKKQPDPGGLVGGLILFMLPGFVYWWLMRRPLLRCQDCGAKVLAREARA
jgi:hypothetical protein